MPMKKLFGRIQDRFSSSTSSLFPSEDLLDAPAPPLEKREHEKTPRWRNRFSFSSVSMKRHGRRRSHSPFFESASTPCFDQQRQQQQQQRRPRSTITNAASTSVLPTSSKTRSETEKGDGKGDDILQPPARPFSCSAAVGDNDMSVPGILKILRTSIDIDDEDDDGETSFNSCRNNSWVNTPNTTPSDIGSSPYSTTSNNNNIIASSPKDNINATSSKAGEDHLKAKLSRNISETNLAGVDDVVLRIHAWQPAVFQTENDATQKQEQEQVAANNEYNGLHMNNEAGGVTTKDSIEPQHGRSPPFRRPQHSKVQQKEDTQWWQKRLQQQRGDARENLKDSSSLTSSEPQYYYDSNCSQNAESCNSNYVLQHANRENAMGDFATSAAKSSDQCTATAASVIRSNEKIDAASELQGTKGASGDGDSNNSKSNSNNGTSNNTNHDNNDKPATIIASTQVDKVIAEMTLAKRLNDALNENSMLKAQIRKMENDAKLATTNAAGGMEPHAKGREFAIATAGREAAAGQQQDELLRTHTLAQLGLIEYLEGEDDLGAALERFKKQLETELSDNNKNNNNGSTNDHT